MSGGAETVLIKSQKLCSATADSSPLRSVENQLDFSAAATRGSAGRAGGSPRTPRPLGTTKMNNSVDPCHNNNINIVTNIRTEPFSDHYTIEDELGRGKFAVVRRCRHRQSGKDYAAKFLRKRRKGKDCRSDVIHEISMLEVVRKHPRLVDLVEVFETSHELIIITEYAAGGELYQHVVREERIEEKEVRRLMRQVLDGLLFLHDRNTVHLDVKPQNVLLTDRLPHGDIKLCDFGFARKVYSGEDVRDIIGTPDYVAPEVLSYEPIHTASDMWSAGVLAYVMLTGYSPFAGDTKQETFLNISQVNIDFPDDLFEDISPLSQEFMMRLLVREPSDRMTARECLHHPWLHMDEGSAVARPSVSPFGSPVGQRRALTPPATDSSPGEEPLKKCRCDDGEATSATPVNINDTVVIATENKMASTSTPQIMEEEDNNNLTLSSPVSSSSVEQTTSKAEADLTSSDVTSTTRTSVDGTKGSKCEDKNMVYANDTSSACLPQADLESEQIC